MAYFRKLPSGRWQATVRGPDGRKHTKTHPLRKVVKDWAAEQESKVAQGSFRDPRSGQVTLSDWHARWRPTRTGLAKSTLRSYDLRWRQEIEPHLAGWKIAALTRIDLEGWVAQLVADGHTVRSVQQAVTVMQAMMTAAVDSGLVLASPAARVQAPKSAQRPPEWFTREEYEAVWGSLLEDATSRAIVDLDMHVGLRWGELAALRADRVDWIRGMLHVVDVMDEDGEIREYPKSKKSRRTVPVPPHVLEQMSALMASRPRESLVFTAPGGGALRQGNWRRRVWRPALEAAGVRYRRPHVMRHTAASWLVMAGVDLYRVQALLGHESFATTQRYAHLAPDAHDVVLGAWKSLGAPVAHERAGGETREPRSTP